MKIKVAVAVLKNKEGHFLITRRSYATSHGGLWEFPGGKLEGNELPLEALKREIMEEVGLSIQDAIFVKAINFDYGDKYIEFFVYLVHKFSGEAMCREGQTDLRWVKSSEFHQYRFPAANVAIFALITEMADVSSISPEH